MKITQKVLLILTTTAVVLLSCASQSKITPMSDVKQDPRWLQVDSLTGIGQYASALTATEVILDEASSKDDWRTSFRAWMYRSRLQGYTGVDRKAVIAQIDSAASISSTPS